MSVSLFSLHSFLPHAPNTAFLPSPESSHLLLGLQKCSEGPPRAVRPPQSREDPTDPEQTSPALYPGCDICWVPALLIQSPWQNHSWKQLSVGKGVYFAYGSIDYTVHHGGKA